MDGARYLEVGKLTIFRRWGTYYASILAADVAGYSRLIGADGVGTLGRPEGNPDLALAGHPMGDQNSERWKAIANALPTLAC
jgi:hypothetical protein